MTQPLDKKQILGLNCYETLYCEACSSETEKGFIMCHYQILIKQLFEIETATAVMFFLKNGEVLNTVADERAIKMPEEGCFWITTKMITDPESNLKTEQSVFFSSKEIACIKMFHSADESKDDLLKSILLAE